MSLDLKSFVSALSQIAEEKNLPQDIVMSTVEAAIAAAYRKDYGTKEQEVRAKIDPSTGAATVWVAREVVETEDDVLDVNTQMSLAEAKKIDKNAEVEGIVEIEDHPKEFGRIAAQTAKQVIIQRIREAEREVIFAEYQDKEGDLVTGMIQRIEDGNIFIDLGRATGIMFPMEQVPTERYYIGQRIKVYVAKVEQATRGPQIVLSRSHPGMVKRLFELEIPEIPAGTVEIRAIAREAGARTKVAVISNQEGVDPVGSCVGQRGTRIQAITAELGEEKVDVIPYNEDPKIYITNALSPAKVTQMDLNDKEKKATVKVPEDQLSLAIGKQGQNVRLAAKLTGWNIDILGGTEEEVEAAAVTEAPSEDKKGKKKKPASGKQIQQQLEDEIIKALEAQSGDESSDSTQVDVETTIKGSKEGGEDRTIEEADADAEKIEEIIADVEEKIDDKKEESE